MMIEDAPPSPSAQGAARGSRATFCLNRFFAFWERQRSDLAPLAGADVRLPTLAPPDSPKVVPGSGKYRRWNIGRTNRRHARRYAAPGYPRADYVRTAQDSHPAAPEHIWGGTGARPKREPAVVKDCTRRCFWLKVLQVWNGRCGFDGWFRQASSLLPPRREDECKDC